MSDRKEEIMDYNREEMCQKIRDALVNYLENHEIETFGRQGKSLTDNSIKYHTQFWVMVHYLYKHVLSTKNRYVTKRYLYYVLLQEGVFESEQECYKMIKHMSKFFGATRISLGIKADAKGYICGNIATVNNVGGVQKLMINFSLKKQKICMEMLYGSFKTLTNKIKCIIIVEKDSALHVMSQCDWCRNNAILITGQGYPSLLIRRFSIKNLFRFRR